MPTSRNRAANRVEPLGASQPCLQARSAVLHHAAGRHVLRAHGLPEGDVLIEVLFKAFDACVGGDALQPRLVERRTDLIGGQTRHAAPLHVSPAHVGRFVERALQVLLGRVAERIELQGDAGFLPTRLSSYGICTENRPARKR